MSASAEDRLRRYVDATLEGVIGDLAARAGGRNEALRDAAIRLGVFVAQGLLDEDLVVRRLFEAAQANGYASKDGERETRSTIHRSLRFGYSDGTVPDELEAILRDVAAERRAVGTFDDEPPPREVRVELRDGDHRGPPPTPEVRAFWETSSSVADDERAAAYLRSRGIDPIAVAESDLARVAGDDPPTWARGWSGRVVVPLFDHRGLMRSMIARDVTGTAERKSLAPASYSRRELLMADGRAQRLLRTGREAARAIVCEGEIDYLVAATQRSDADESAALGIFSGSWSPAIAARIADGSELVIATDADEAGEKYSAAIVETLSKRPAVRVSRWRSSAGDLAKAGGLAGGTVTPIRREGEPLDARAVLDAWRKDGALVHEPTGIETLDRITRGGLVYGTTAYLQGAPNACKTVFMLHVAHGYATRGIVVGIMAADESADDLVTRLAQRIGFERDDVEKREHGAIDVLERHLGGLPILFFDDESTIESAAEQLVRAASGRRCMLAVDSIQVVRCALEAASERELSEQRAISARAIALRRVAQKHRMLVLVTSETSRASYRARTEEDRVEDIAAGKGSGSIEYKSKVLLTMRKLKRAPGVYSVSPTKNKLQRDDSEDPFYLRLDRDRQVLEEVEKPADETSAEQAAARAEREARDTARDAKVAELAESMLAALVQANAKGAKIAARSDLLGLLKGDSTLKGKAITQLIAEGRITGGRGKPFRPKYPGELELELDKPDPKPARNAAAAQQVLEDAVVVALVLAAQPGLGARDLRAAARARSGTMSSPRVDAGLARLGPAAVRVPRKQGQAHYIDGSKLPSDILAALPTEEREAVTAARPAPPEAS